MNELRWLFLWLAFACVAAGGDIKVKVEGVRNAEGVLQVILYSSAEGFPEDHTKAVAVGQAKAKAGTVTVTLKNVKVKRGAIIVLHDEDSDQKLKKNLFGVPREGVGASNWLKFGRPKFANAVIDLKAGQVVPVKLRYY